MVSLYNVRFKLNTYGSPPNSELLRKYGHIDLDLLSTEILSKLSQEEIGGWPYGNPGDEVQLDGQMVANVVGVEAGGAGTPEWKSKVKVRVDAWLDDGQDE